MRFANPDALQLLWLIPLMWFVAWVFERRSGRRLRSAFGARLTPYLTATVSPGKRRLKLALRLLALVCWIGALARPQTGRSAQEVKVRGVEIMIAVDVSNSMLAEDVRPSRLLHAKAELMRLLHLLSGDKVGLIAFAGSAVLLSPLTTDKSALEMFIDSLSPESVETQGTNIKQALNEAQSAFNRGGVESDESTQISRVILIASDGEDHDKEALDEAKRLAVKGTRIFTMAFGTEKGGPIPIRDERGFLRGYKRDKSGQNVVTTVKGEFLRKLAEAGKGSFYHATFGGQEARRIKDDLSKLEQGEFASEMETNYDEKFQFPLVLGILLCLVELMLGERRGGVRIWKGRFDTGAGLTVLAILAIGGLGAPPDSKAGELKGVIINNEGVRTFSEERRVEAHERFMESLAEVPFSPEVHYNIGTSFLVNQEFEKALSEYEQTLKLAAGAGKREAALRFHAHFNAAIALTQLKRIDEALEHYQRALDLNPESVETKTNIELLTQNQTGGQGEGEQQKQDSDNQSGQDQNNQGQAPHQEPTDQQKKRQQGNQKKQEPRPFDSEQLSKQDVQKILEELKRQEEQIRAKMQREGAKDAPPDKDW